MSKRCKKPAESQQELVKTQEELVEFFHNDKKYVAKTSDIFDRGGQLMAGAVVLPSGIVFDLNQMRYITCDEHGIPYSRPRFVFKQNPWHIRVAYARMADD